MTESSKLQTPTSRFRFGIGVSVAVKPKPLVNAQSQLVTVTDPHWDQLHDAIFTVSDEL